MKFEICRGDSGYWARFMGDNGEEIWRTSETYVRSADAVHAVDLIDPGESCRRMDHIDLRTKE